MLRGLSDRARLRREKRLLKKNTDNWLAPRNKRGRRKFMRTVAFGGALAGAFLVLSYTAQFDAVTKEHIGWAVKRAFRVIKDNKPYLISATVVVALTSGSTWSVPSGFPSGANNTVECIGAGANGAAGSSGSGSSTGGNGGVGGGAGAYALQSNVTATPGGTANIQIGAANSGTSTWFGSSTTVLAAAASGQNAGLSTSSIGSTTASGGKGGNAGNGANPFFDGGGGGGGGGAGAAGPNGAGNNGSNGSSTSNGSGANAGGGGTGDAGNTAVGANGAQYSLTGGGSVGSGGGANGGNGGAGASNGASGSYGSNAGLYGGGGGGGGGGGAGISSDGSGGAAGLGTGGLIVVTYTPMYVVGKLNRVYLRR